MRQCAKVYFQSKRGTKWAEIRHWV